MSSEYRSIAQETWNAIAESFDTTRQKPWKYCLNFIQTLQKDDVVADIGCGNGRHLVPCAEQCASVFGVDISIKMLRIAKKKIQGGSHRNVTLVHADAVHLPFNENSFDAVLFIASLHNIHGKVHRISALNELRRVLKPNAVALISVWSRWQKKYYRFFLKQFFIRPGEFGDIEVCWRQHNLNHPRFYHMYSKNEFYRELHRTGFDIIRLDCVRIHSKRYPDNYFALVRRR